MNLYRCVVCHIEHTHKEPGIRSEWIGGQCNGTQWFFVCPKKDKKHKPVREFGIVYWMPDNPNHSHYRIWQEAVEANS